MKSTVYFCALTVLCFASSAQAQVYVGGPVVAQYPPPAVGVPVATYCAPRVVRYAPVVRPRVALYAPAPRVVVSRPVVAAPAPVVAAPVVVGRPLRLGANIYGGPQVYVPFQPVRNTLRFLTPY